MLDYFERRHGATIPVSPPACAAFQPAPLDSAQLPTSGESTRGAVRRAYLGDSTVGLASDWTVGTASRN
jgi:hypothetical protein